MRNALLTLMFASAVLFHGPAQSQVRDYGERLERSAILRAEMKRARELGGYSDPISALCDLFSGNVKEKDFQQNINSLEEARDVLNEPQRPKYYTED